MSISIRFASGSDAPALAALCGFVHELHVDGRPDVFKTLSVDVLTAWFAGAVGTSLQRGLIAEEGSTALGYAWIVVRDRAESAFSFGRRWLEIDHLGVNPRYRRAGVARLLVERASAIAREEGFGSVELNSWCFNREAQAAFVAMGFEPQTRRFERRVSTNP